MTVHNFAWVMSCKFKIGEHEVRIVQNEKIIFNGTFDEILRKNISMKLSEAEILGVSMMSTKTKGDSLEYVTLISI